MKHLTKIFLALTLFLSGCRDGSLYPNGGELFVAQSNAIGVYTNGRQTFIYDPTEHQTASRGSSFRIQTDDQSVYFHLKLEPQPSPSSPTTSGTISTIGVAGLEDQTIEFQLVKQIDNKMWLWNEAQKTGVIISLK